MGERDQRAWRIERVLAAVDLSSDADEVLRQADQLARLHGARVTALSVLPEVTRILPLFPHLSHATNVDWIRIERRALEVLTARVAAVTGRNFDDFEIELGTGSPDSQIVEHAERLGAQLIVAVVVLILSIVPGTGSAPQLGTPERCRMALRWSSARDAICQDLPALPCRCSCAG